MPQFGRKGDLLTVSYITGPKHMWLGVTFSRERVGEPTVVKNPRIGSCFHGEIDEVQLVAAVVAGAGEHGLFPQRIEYVENDSPDYGLYRACARLLAERVVAPRRDPSTDWVDDEVTWPCPPNTASFTSADVLDRGEPIVFVSHDDDGAWQFHSAAGAPPAASDARVVALRTIIALDPSIVVLADLERGWSAHRDGRGGAWRRERR